MARETRAVKLFSDGFACSQAILAAFCEPYGLEESLALRLASGFAGGMKSAEVCGAISGAVMVIGLKHGHVGSDIRESRRVAGAQVEEFMHAFKGQHGVLTCRDLLGCDITTPNGRQIALDNKLFVTRCVDLVRDVAMILEAKGY